MINIPKDSNIELYIKQLDQIRKDQSKENIDNSETKQENKKEFSGKNNFVPKKEYNIIEYNLEDKINENIQIKNENSPSSEIHNESLQFFLL